MLSIQRMWLDVFMFVVENCWNIVDFIVLRHLNLSKIYLTEAVSVVIITYWICFTGWPEELNVWVKIWNIYFVYKIYWKILLIHAFL